MKNRNIFILNLTYFENGWLPRIAGRSLPLFPTVTDTIFIYDAVRTCVRRFEHPSYYVTFEEIQLFATTISYNNSVLCFNSSAALIVLLYLKFVLKKKFSNTAILSLLRNASRILRGIRAIAIFKEMIIVIKEFEYKKVLGNLYWILATFF